MNIADTNKSPVNKYWSIDWLLLIFLCLFMVDKVVVKPVAILAALIWLRKHIRIGDIRSAPLFYILIPSFEIVKFFLFNNDFSKGHIFSFITGECYWIMCLLAFLIIYIRVKIDESRTLHNTIVAFFYINFVWSVANLALTMINAGTWDPYSSSLAEFGNSAGDYIKGIFMAPCYINAFFNSFAAIYFLHKKEYFNSFFAVIVVCITTSNFVNIIFIPILLLQLLVLKDRRAKYTILSLFAFFILFYLFASLENVKYTLRSLQIKKNDISEIKTLKNNNSISPKISDSILYPNGKVVSLRETMTYLLASPKHFLLGAGMGNFSSLLAVRTSDIQVPGGGSRLFRMNPQHIDSDFYENHYQIYKAIYSLPKEYHSTRHLPSSFLNQILGEYGIVGLVFFLFFYVWFFLKRFRRIRYTFYMAILLGGFFFFDYLFEYLSIIVLFELFFLMDIKEHTEPDKI